MKKRARSRGAAMLEAALVMPVLVACWVAGVYAQTAVTAKLDAIQTARSQAWGYASANCGSPGDAGPSPAAQMGGTVVSAGNSPSGIVQGLAAQNGSGDATSLILKLASAFLPPFPGSQASDTRDAKVARYASSHSSKMTVICNEAPHNGSLPGVFKEIFFMVTK